MSNENGPEYLRTIEFGLSPEKKEIDKFQGRGSREFA